MPPRRSSEHPPIAEGEPAPGKGGANLELRLFLLAV